MRMSGVCRVSRLFETLIFSYCLSFFHMCYLFYYAINMLSFLFSDHLVGVDPFRAHRFRCVMATLHFRSNQIKVKQNFLAIGNIIMFHPSHSTNCTSRNIVYKTFRMYWRQSSGIGLTALELEQWSMEIIWRNIKEYMFMCAFFILLYVTSPL